MASTPQETSLDMKINSTRILESAVLPGESDCLPIYVKMQRPSSPAKIPQLQKSFLGPTFRALLALILSSLPSSSPPFPMVLFGATMLIGFAV
ncbi:hypothetical protein SDJN03_23581, partial [Cucurbita argyrosperma subsp. sororia]